MLVLNHAGADPMSNHIPKFTRPDLVLPAVLDFLERHGDASPGETSGVEDLPPVHPRGLLPEGVAEEELDPLGPQVGVSG